MRGGGEDTASKTRGTKTKMPLLSLKEKEGRALKVLEKKNG